MGDYMKKYISVILAFFVLASSILYCRIEKTSSKNIRLACKRRIGNNNVPVFRFILIKILSGNDIGMFYLKSVFLQRQYKFTVRGIKRTPYHCIFRKIFDYRQYGILGSIIFIPTTFNT